MREGGQKFNTNQMYPQILDAVDDAAGKIQALPLGLALPVLLTNRAFLKKAGLDSQSPPQTWKELQKAAGAISESGVVCPLTSSQFSWVHVENISSQAGVPMMVRERRTERVNANSLIAVKHLALLASWQKSHYFRYDGPALEGDERFLSGECAMLTGASSLYAAAVRAGIDVGVSRLPYYDDVHGAKPADVLPDGISLWTLAGYKPNDYKLVARLVVFLMRPDVQQEWVRATSYLPMTPAAVAALRESGIPGNLLDAAEKRLSAPRKGSTRMKAGPLRDRLHEFLGEELPMVWDAERPAKDALDTTVSRLVALEPTPAVKTVKAAKVSKK
jgi:sn-glycerol 3-phosphate transport system substrate-binding protein